ncbi:MAG: DUF4093 domain-containing protein [Oscillospiraceae bacterium]|nr:DUF4093 domain-containing protein [Oscillospiraceae bacterium]
MVPAVVVEGKYDQIRISAYFDCVILVTDGFRIYKRPEQLALIRHYARTTGVVILTDADAAGFQIRGYLKGAVTEGKLYHVYIPGIHGKEKRKTKPSAEGTLGVEGMDREILTEAFRRAGVLELQEKPFEGSPVTPALLYDHGLMGTPDCTLRRRALLEAMQLPPRLSVSGLCEVLSTMTCAEQLSEFLQSYLPDDGGAACS